MRKCFTTAQSSEKNTRSGHHERTSTVVTWERGKTTRFDVEHVHVPVTDFLGVTAGATIVVGNLVWRIQVHQAARPKPTFQMSKGYRTQRHN